MILAISFFILTALILVAFKVGAVPFARFAIRRGWMR